MQDNNQTFEQFTEADCKVHLNPRLDEGGEVGRPGLLKIQSLSRADRELSKAESVPDDLVVNGEQS